ncbi:hypothetical protein IFN73_11325, partial [Francisella tularensis subsp. holarctica]|nr:hypothetical protein [Francisella tularensis subsp. holarctica]
EVIVCLPELDGIVIAGMFFFASFVKSFAAISIAIVFLVFDANPLSNPSLAETAQKVSCA